MADQLVVAHTGTVLTVGSAPGSTLDLHALCVRDACACHDCRRPSTNERILDSTTIPLEIEIVSVHETPEHVVVHTSDGHAVRIDQSWLVEHVRTSERRDEPAGDAQLWTGTDGGVTVFQRRDLDREPGVFRWLDAVLRRGSAVVRGVDPDDAGLRAVAAIVGEIRATNYGVTWAIEADLDPVSAVDSERHLLVHTDLPYRDVAPGVQFLLASVVDVAGGETTLVDGYGVAEQIRRHDPEAWRLLTTVEFSYPFIRDGIELVGKAPIIGLHPDGRYHQIRRAPDLVGIPYLQTAADAPSLYAALRTWTAAVDDPANEIRVALAPGDLLAFDNHRLLHGRTAFELGARGRRRLIGCYLDIEDVRSRRAVAAARGRADSRRPVDTT